MNLKDLYHKNGYIHLKNVITQNDVLKIKTDVLNNLGENFKGHKGIDLVLKFEQLYLCQFNDKVLRALSEIFGSDFYYINDFDLQIKNQDTRGKSKGWHIDANSELSRLCQYLFSSDYQFCKVGLYFSNNSYEHGGGIDLEESGHKSFKDFGSKLLNIFYYYFDRKLISKFRKRIIVPIEAGDCLIFDSRLPHAASFPNVSSLNNAEAKFTLYWDVSGNKTQAKNFIDNSIIRCLTEGSAGNFYTNYLRFHFPNSYPQSYQNLARDNCVNVYSLDLNDNALFQKKWSDLSLNDYSHSVNY
jgi:hypothetical protein